MNLSFDSVRISQGTFVLNINETFTEGLHLFSGRIGTGKTTLAFTAAGLLSPDKGTIRYDGCSGTPMFLMQFPEYHVTGATVREEISSWSVSGHEDPFSLLGVEISDHDPLTLSRGELRRLELACVFSRDADLLILDEPYPSLDRPAKQSLTKLLETRRGITLVFSHESEYIPANAKHWSLCGGKVQS